jgi:hypothetical protein
VGSIRLEDLLPEEFVRPDDASPIGAWRLPIDLTATCVGFNPPNCVGEVLFEEETPIQIRLCERTWCYRYPGEHGSIHITNRWRLEIIVDSKQTRLRPECVAVIAQEPYGTNWVQTAKFKMYFKKGDAHRPESVVPALENEHPVDWLERNLKYDPWENGTHYVAGIGFPNGYWAEPRNTTGNFVFGACPDVDKLFKSISCAHSTIKMLRLTECDAIDFWYTAGNIKNPPKLSRRVIDDAPSLMNRSIIQAMAGPSDNCSWQGRPVSTLVQRIYCDHLNDENRKVARELKYEIPAADDLEQSKSPTGDPQFVPNDEEDLEV